MQAFGVLALVAGYCAWYTLYQRTWGDGSGYLFNLTGAQRFQNPAAFGKQVQATGSGGSGSAAPPWQVKTGVPFGK